MTVYVDAAIHQWRGRRWCHLFSEDLDALHDFAQRIGMQRRWFQKPPKASWPHYDITASKRRIALDLGAVEADRWTTAITAKRIMVPYSRLHLPHNVESAERALALWEERYLAHLERKLDA